MLRTISEFAITLTAPRKTIISLDVFDTIILRNTHPDRLLLNVFARIAEKSNGSISKEYAEDAFHSAYYDLSRLNESRGLNQEVLSASFFLEFARRIRHWDNSCSTKADLITECFIEEECASSRCNKRLIDIVGSLESRIILISDMYYSSQMIKAILARLCPPEFVEKISFAYVSSEYALLKKTGDLFRHVAAIECIDKSKSILHIGDNRLSDWTKAREAGFDAILYRPNRLRSGRVARASARISDLLTAFN